MDTDKLARMRKWHGRHGIVYEEIDLGGGDKAGSLHVPQSAHDAMTEAERTEFAADFPGRKE